MNDTILVISNFPDRASAELAANALVADRLAACVNVLAECVSIYRWKGIVEHTSEVPLLIKTTRSAYAQLETILRDKHPYELPEIIALTIDGGLPEYLNWITQEVRQTIKS